MPLGERLNVVISIASMVAAFSALWVAIVAIRHADAGTDQLLSELTKQSQELDQQRQLLDRSRNTLEGLLGQADIQLKQSETIVAQLNNQLELDKKQTAQLGQQLELNREQIRLASEQLNTETMQYVAETQEFSKQGDLHQVLACTSRAWIPRTVTVTESAANMNERRFQMDAPGKDADFDCVLTITNQGTDEIRQVDAELDVDNIRRQDTGPHADSGPFPKFRDISINAEEQSTTAKNGKLILHRWSTVERNSLSDASYTAQFTVEIRQSYPGPVESFAVAVIVRGRNVHDSKKFYDFRVRWPNDRYWNGR